MIPPGFISIRKAYAKFHERHGSEAAARLGFLLCKGELPAFCFDAQTAEQSIPADVWKNKPDSVRIDILINGAQQEIVVRETDLNALLTSADNAPQVAQQREHSSAKGRPAYDREIIWAGLAWVHHNEGLPHTLNDKVARIQQWYSQWFDTEPSRTILQPIIKRFEAILAGADPPVVFEPRLKRNQPRSKKTKKAKR
jgi:hypothetical protein